MRRSNCFKLERGTIPILKLECGAVTALKLESGSVTFLNFNMVQYLL